MKNYYGALDHIDWVAYYKNHGYQINAGCGGRRAAAASTTPRSFGPEPDWAVPQGPIKARPALPAVCRLPRRRLPGGYAPRHARAGGY